MRIFVSKYALTSGIHEAEGEITKTSERMVDVKIPGRWQNYFHKPYWHLTMEEAVKQAELMRTKKIASHEKSIAKLKKLTF